MPHYSRLTNYLCSFRSQFYELFIDLSSRQSQDNQQLRIDLGLTLLRKECLTSRLRYYDSRIRCLAWRSFLGLLPQTGANINETVAAWSEAAFAWRQKYEACKNEAHVDPRGEQVSDPSLHNPLSDAEDSPVRSVTRSVLDTFTSFKRICSGTNIGETKN